MTLRSLLALLAILAATMLVAAGCGDGNDDESEGEDDGPSAVACDDEEALAAIEDEAERIRRSKECSVEESQAAFEKDETIDQCVNLGRSYMALASPESTGDPEDTPEAPEDREENLDKAVETYERCLEIDGDNTDVKRSLASAYMATSAYDEAAPLLEDIAREQKTDPNAWYAWGLAASNSGDTAGTKAAWTNFLKHADKDDPRVSQVRQSLKVINQTGTTGNEAANADEAEGDEDEGGDDEG